MAAHRELLFLCFATTAASTATTMLMLIVPLLALEYGLGAAGIGAVVSSAFLLPLLLAVPTGRIVDRFGTHRMLISGYLVFFGALVPAALHSSLTTLVFGYVAATLGQLVSVVASQSLVAELGAGSGRESAYGWWTTSVAAGQFIGPLLAGIALDVWSPSIVFLAPMLSVGLAIVLAPRVRTQVEAHESVVVPPVPTSSAFGVLRDRVVLIAIATSSGALWAMTVFATYFPVLLSDLAFPAFTIGALMSLRALASVLVRPVMPQVVHLLGGRQRTVVLTLISLGLGLVALAATETLIVFAVICVVLGVSSGLSQPVSMVMVAERIPSGERGRVLGIRLMGNRLAQLVAPIALALVAEAIGLRWIFVGHGVIVIFASIGLLNLVRRTARAQDTV